MGNNKRVKNLEATNGVNGKVPLKTKIFFGMGDIFGGGAFNIINFFYTIFLTDVVDLQMIWVAPIFLIGKIWDALTDPLMGTISDKTKSKFGRRRPYFLAGIFFIFISFIILWFPVDFGQQIAKFLYVLFAYLFFNTVVTMVMVPYQAMAAEITLDYNERTSVNSIRLFFSLASSLCCALFPLMIVNAFDDIRIGYIVMSVIFALAFSLPWIGVFKYTHERKDFKVNESKFNLVNMVIEPFKIKSFRYLLLMFLAGYLGMDIVSMIFAYYMKYYVNQPNAVSLVLGVLLIVEILFVPIYAKIAEKIGKNRAFMIGASIWIIGALVIFFIPRTASLPVIFGVAALIGAGVSAVAVMPHTIFGDVTDVGELAYGERREGNFSGLITLVRKFASGIAIAFATFFLGLVGYLNPLSETVDGVEKMIEQQQPEAVLLAIRIIIAIVPIVLMVVGIIAAKKYPLTKNIHKKLISFLNFKRGVSKDGDLSKEEIDELKKELI